ncbi:IS4 family transposase [Porticoccaceae bacterium]|nr:IS4 family transposase [Porticoccaceae bacterium]
MQRNRTATKIQRQRFQHHATGTDAHQFFNLLTSDNLLNVVEAQLPAHRERQFPPTETLSMFLAQALNNDSSCQKAVNDWAVSRALSGLMSSTATGGYCRARQRLPTDMVSVLVRHTALCMDDYIPEAWRWQGRAVRLVDGTTVSMPDTPANQLAYAQQGGQQPGLGFPICRMVGVICLASGAVLNAAMGQIHGKGASEHHLLRSLLDTFNRGDIVLGDAFYGSYFLLAALIARGVDVVFEQFGPRKRVSDFRLGKKIGTKDHLVEIKKPVKKPDWMSDQDFALLPDTLTIREVAVKGKILITTLLSTHEASKDALKQLYKSRWHIEVDFRHIKTTLGMETLHCKTPDMNMKELWVYLLAYNLIRLLMAQSALLADLNPRQLSFKHALQLWQSWRSLASDTLSVEILFALMSQRIVGNRPGRIEPRAIKRRPKAMPLLMVPRAQARENIRKNGHPRKLK